MEINLSFLKSRCLFTKSRATVTTDRDTTDKIYDSESLGKYYVSEDLFLSFQDSKKDPSLSQSGANCAHHCLALKGESPHHMPYWTTDVDKSLENILAARNQLDLRRQFIACDFERISSQQVDHSQKPLLLLEGFAKDLQNTNAFGQIALNEAHMARARIVNQEELIVILDYLSSEGYLNEKSKPLRQNRNDLPLGMYEFSMTPQGWERVSSRILAQSGNRVFIAMQFHWPENEGERVLAYQAIKDCCSELGYQAEIVHQGTTENITDQIISDIKSARFVVAEFTYNNRGVYYEAGFARALGKKVFHLVKDGFDVRTSNIAESIKLDAEGRRLHFDIEQVMYRKWNSPEDLKKKLKSWIESSEGSLLP